VNKSLERWRTECHQSLEASRRRRAVRAASTSAERCFKAALILLIALIVVGLIIGLAYLPV
jgi:hypothetical protein